MDDDRRGSCDPEGAWAPAVHFATAMQMRMNTPEEGRYTHNEGVKSGLNGQWRHLAGACGVVRCARSKLTNLRCTIDALLLATESVR